MLSSRLQNPSNNPEQREEKQQHQCKKSSDNATTTIEDQEGELAVVPKHNHRELNALVDYNRNGRATNNANRRDQFTSFVSNPDNKKLLKRICIKAGNNARFFLSKVSKSFKKVTLRDFGVMSSSNLEQGRVKAVKISEIETPAQFALCIEHGLQLNDLVFAALADGGRLEVLKYIHDHLLPDKMYLNSLAVEYASQNNHLQTLQYLVEYHNAPLCKDACWRAAWKGSFECLQYLVLERKCPFDRHECHESPTKADILTSRDGLKSINNSINIIIIIIGDYYTTALNALLLFFDALLLVIIKYSFFSFRIFLLLLAKYAFPH